MSNPATITGWLLRAAFWLPLMLCTWLALAPAPPEIPFFHFSDVVQHAFAFSYLSFALMLAYSSCSPLQTLVLLLLYGIGIELVQSLEVERSAEWKDLGVDVIGISLGLLLARLWVVQLRIGVSRVVSSLLSS